MYVLYVRYLRFGWIKAERFESDFEVMVVDSLFCSRPKSENYRMISMILLLLIITRAFYATLRQPLPSTLRWAPPIALFLLVAISLGLDALTFLVQIFALLSIVASMLAGVSRWPKATHMQTRGLNEYIKDHSSLLMDNKGQCIEAQGWSPFISYE